MHHQVNRKGKQMVKFENFDEAVELVKTLGNGMLLEGLVYVRDCLDNDEEYLVSRWHIMAYHLICQRMRPLFVAPNE